MRQFFLVNTGVFMVFVFGSVACDSTLRRGRAGESCTSANDCGSGLACVAQTCAATETETDGGNASAGSSCNARRDCALGFLCVSNLCQPASMGTDPSQARYSGKGETCQAKNDCEADLACVMGMCRQVELPLGYTGKSCYRVECSTKVDCCASFTPNANCAAYKQSCDSDPVFCSTYRSLCVCSQDCVAEVCVAAAPGCMSNGECTSLQTPYCVQNKCRQCDKDSACPGSKCVEGVCMSACTIDENCPALNKCQSGVCVESGCKSDRECAFMTGNPLALCHETECRVPCSADPDCANDKMTQGFGVCEQGQCVFVGCENDAECRALLRLDRTAGKTHAVCR
jgi:hypothetical protein